MRRGGRPRGRISTNRSRRHFVTRNVPSRSADELAARIGVSRRTLFRNFREAHGLSPLRHLQLVRLHGLRQRLLSAEHVPSITSAAGDFDFGHIGQGQPAHVAISANAQARASAGRARSG